jgi:hypothetical protein
LSSSDIDADGDEDGTVDREGQEEGEGEHDTSLPVSITALPTEDVVDDTINTVNTATSSLRTPVHERLYALKDKKMNQKVSPSIHPKYLQEIEGCTFHPTIHPMVPIVKQSRDKVNSRSIHDYDKSVNRIRKVQFEKQKKKEDEENEALDEIRSKYHVK